MSEMEHTATPEPQRENALQEAEERGRLTELRQQLYGSATRLLCEAATLQPGDQVLDIAAGTGDQSRLAARLVGPQGRVLATDISQEMLDVAARLAHQEGVSNLTTRAMNAEQLDLPDDQYDAVISRFGLMLIPRVQQALREIRRVLKPGGRIAALVWSKPERNPLFVLPDPIIAHTLEEREAEAQRSDPFSLADAAIFARRLTEAGFQDVHVQTLPLTFHFPSFELLTAWWGSSFKKAQAALEPEASQRMLEQIRQAVRPFEEPQGIVAPAEVLVGTGMKERQGSL